MTARELELVIVGLGPGDRSMRTLAVQEALDHADHIVLRTRIHPGLEDLRHDHRVIDCDDIYQQGVNFTTVYRAIADRVISLAREGGSVVYAVPGHPRFGERTVALVESVAAECGVTVEVLDGVSFVDASMNTLQIDALSNGLQIADAEALASAGDAEPFGSGLLGVDPARPLLVAQIYNGEIAARVKLALSRVFPDEHPVVLLHAAGVASEERLHHLRLCELDRINVAHLTSLWVPALASLDALRSPETLLRIVAHLRTPEGCPWDRKQTYSTLRDAILEEAHETVDAIDDHRVDALVEELGDLQLLVAMQAQIAEEAGDFRIEDVFEAINRKLIRRHPHVFGNVTANTPEEVIVTWESVKAEERAERAVQPVVDPLAKLPRSMPITRVAAELLAPRVTLCPPRDASDGDDLLMAIEKLLAMGVDPERALEASLRRTLESKQT